MHARQRWLIAMVVVGLFGTLVALEREQRPSQAADKAEQLPAAKATFVLGPYLQYPTQTSITIMWETPTPATSTVEFGVLAADMKKVEPKGLATIHEVTLANLTPETRYVYRVSSTDEKGTTLTSNLYQFMTAVKADSAFSFAVIGDTQRNAKMTGQIAKVLYERRPHFVIHCGDVVDTGSDKNQWVNDLFIPSAELFARAAVFPTLGNHEKNHDWYYKYFSLPKPEYYYRYSYGNADFFVVDSNKSLKPDSEQYQWLDAELGKSTATWKFVYHHHPVWSSDADDYGDTKRGIARLGDLNARNLQTLYEKHNIAMAFNGHIHAYERTWPLREGKVNRKNGITYITSGGGGGKLEEFSPLPTWFKAQVRVDFHGCYINIQGNHLEFKAFDQNANLFDQFEMEK
jgi:predicted phosphodiesterase